MALAGALLGGLSTLGSGLLNYFGQRQANKTNIRLAKEGREFEKEMWNLQNQYNLPSEQMKRLEAAGLNPHLVYGTGNVAGNTQGGRPNAHVAEVSNELGKLQLPNPLNILREYQDYQVKRDQSDNIQAQTELTNSRRVNEDVRTAILGTRSKSDALKYGIAKKLEETQVSTAQENLERVRQQNKLYREQVGKAKYDRELKRLETEMQSDLRPYNMTVSDSIWARLLNKLFKEVKDVRPIKIPK